MNNNYEELSLDKIMNILADKFPDHIIVESSDYESDSKEIKIENIVDYIKTYINLNK